MHDPLRVLMITSEWPTPEHPYDVPFIVRQVKYLKNHGVMVQPFPFRGGKNPKKYARFWRAAQAEIATGKYDLVHAQWGQSGLLALPRHIPLVVTFRGDDLEGIIGISGRQTAQGLVLKLISRLVARVADEAIVVSESLARLLPRKSYTLVPSGLDLNLFCPAPQAEARRRLGLDPEKRYILFAGSVNNPRKRFSLAQQAVNRVQQSLDAELLVASGVPHDQIPDYMNAADALLLVSRHEGSPNVVKEAMACNLPIVSTPVGDVAQRIGDIPGCIVLEDDQPDAIADSLMKVLHPGKRVKSREKVLDLDESLLTQKVISVYRKALKDKQPGFSK